MKKVNSIAKTNVYLKDAIVRQKMIRQSVISSSAVEGIYVTSKDLDKNENNAKTSKSDH